MCALSVLPFATTETFAALNCPDGQYPNSSGGCSISSGHTPTDQGSIAQNNLDNYHANKSNFSRYKQEWDNLNKKNLNLITRLNTPLVHQYQLLAARLAKWHKEDATGFANYFRSVKTYPPIDLVTDLPDDVLSERNRNTMMSFVMSAFMQERNDFLVGQHNTHLQNIAHLYFQMNPTVMKSVAIDYWAKAYAPSVSGKIGFTSAYSDSVSLPDVQAVYPFIRAADINDYDFSQIEESFVNKWNNANTSPSKSTTKTTKYYKFVPQPLPNEFFNKLSEKIDQRLITKVNNETFAKTQSEIVGFRFKNLMRTYLAANGPKAELITKLANQTSAFPLPQNITQISRAINQAKRTCLAPAESLVLAGKIDLQHKVVSKNCSAGDRSLDWFVIKNADETIQLKNAFSGQCLTAPRQSYDGPLTMVCGGRVNTYKPAYQAWQWTGDERLRRSGIDHLYSLSVMAPTDLSSSWREGRKLDLYPYDFLQGNEALRAKWSIGSGFGRNEMLNPQSYKSAAQLAENFFALMYGFTEELALMDRIKVVNKGTTLPTEDLESSISADTFTSQEQAVKFFNALYADSGLYNQLPPSMQQFITALRSGTSLLDAYSRYAPSLYDEIRQASLFKPSQWDDPSNKKNALHVYENPYTNTVDLFTSKFDGSPAASNKWLPINRRSDNNWTYVTSLGSKAKVAKLIEKISAHFKEWGEPANYGDIFLYDNPYSKKREFFQATFKGSSNSSSAYFPTNQTSTSKWRFLGEKDNANVLIAALANDTNRSYLSYMYSLVKLNIGGKRSLADVESSPDSETDGFDSSNWTQSGADGQSVAGQHFYVSTPTVTAITLYSANNVAALGAISNAVIGMKTRLPIIFERAQMWSRFEEMVTPRLKDIWEDYEVTAEEIGDAAGATAEELKNWRVTPSNIWEDWSKGNLNPPAEFEQFKEEFRALFAPGRQGDEDLEAYLDNFAEPEEGRSMMQVEEQVIAEEQAINNSLLSTAFEAFTVTETSLAASLVTVDSVTSTLIGLAVGVP